VFLINKKEDSMTDEFGPGGTVECNAMERPGPHKCWGCKKKFRHLPVRFSLGISAGRWCGRCWKSSGLKSGSWVDKGDRDLR
jgi:hypothetical protein